MKTYKKRKMKWLKINYIYYVNSSKYFNFEQLILEEEFIKIFDILYDNITLLTSIFVVEKILEDFTKLMICDAYDLYKVNIEYIINHLWLLHLITKNEKVDKMIMPLQDKLYSEFDIKNNSVKKIKQKIYTKYMITF